MLRDECRLKTHREVSQGGSLGEEVSNLTKKAPDDASICLSKTCLMQHLSSTSSSLTAARLSQFFLTEATISLGVTSSLHCFAIHLVQANRHTVLACIVLTALSNATQRHTGERSGIPAGRKGEASAKRRTDHRLLTLAALQQLALQCAD